METTTCHIPVVRRAQTHGATTAAMPPDHRQAIEKEMAVDLKEKTQEQAGKKQADIGASIC
jgi:hypothetical protein